MGCGFAISPVVVVMTQDESKIKGTLYIFIYVYIEVGSKQIIPALKHLGYHKRPPVKWKPLTSEAFGSVGMQRKGKCRM